MKRVKKWTLCLVATLGFLSTTCAGEISDRVCVSSCQHLPRGYYPSCGDCGEFVACADGTLLTLKCPAGEGWDDVTKACGKKHLDICRQGDQAVMQPSVNVSEISEISQMPHGKLAVDTFQSDIKAALIKWINKMFEDNTDGRSDQETTTRPSSMENDLKLLSDKIQLSPSRPKLDQSSVPKSINPSSHQANDTMDDIRANHVEVKTLESGIGQDIMVNTPDGKSAGTLTNGETKTNLSQELRADQATTQTGLKLLKDKFKMNDTGVLGELRHHLEATNEMWATQNKRADENGLVSGDCFIKPGSRVTTFDHYEFPVVGDCRYVAARLCDSSDFFVEVKMRVDKANASRTVVDYVDVSVTSKWARLHSVGVAFADEIVVPPGRSETNEKFTVETEAEFSQLTTVDGITVTMDRQNRFFLFLPAIYSGKVCGLCGNMNGDVTDDVRVPAAVFDYYLRPVPAQSPACASQFNPPKE